MPEFMYIYIILYIMPLIIYIYIGSDNLAHVLNIILTKFEHYSTTESTEVKTRK